MRECTKQWNTTLYLRLSRDDGDKEESNSITGQRELLRSYLKQHPELQEYAVRVDDGFSGSTFERPAFQAMMEDVRAGKTNCIVVKDLSRFGRNYLDAGEYIERVFPFMKVRFIAINDNYDSLAEKKASDDLIIPFKNLINEAYCRDISIKIRSQLEIKRKSGQFIGAFAMFGYAKEPNHKNRLIVDDYAADIVRDIFQWKLEGVSPADIATALNKVGVLSPTEYKRAMGIRYATPFQTNPKAVWSAGNVIRILKNPIYTGVLIQGKESTPSYKVHKRITRPESEWAVVEESHEAIISKEDFDTVQKVLAMDTRRSTEASAVSLFSGMLKCGECGASMVRKVVPSGKKAYGYYICSAHKKHGSCHPHRIRDITLEDIVLTALQGYIRQVIDLEQLLEMTDTAPLRTAQAQRVQRQLDMKRGELERANKLLMSLYENLADEIITRDEYTKLKATFSLQIDTVEQQMNLLLGEISNIQSQGTEKSWMEQFRSHENLTALERRIVVTLIDEIAIYADKCVEVRYRWQDEFTWQAEVLLQLAQKEAV